jgi:hypothetical protein
MKIEPKSRSPGGTTRVSEIAVSHAVAPRLESFDPQKPGTEVPGYQIPFLRNSKAQHQNAPGRGASGLYGSQRIPDSTTTHNSGTAKKTVSAKSIASGLLAPGGDHAVLLETPRPLFLHVVGSFISRWKK